MKKSVLPGHLAALFTILFWGTTFVSTKILLQDLSPLEILFSRFLLGWIAIWLLRPAWLPFQGKKEEILFACAGLCGVTLYFLLENIALVYTMAANVSVIVCVSPFFTALLAWRFLGAPRPGFNFFTGFALAIGGISLIACNGAILKMNPAGDILAFLAAIAWAVYSILVRKLSLKGYGALISTRRIFFYGLLFMLPCFLAEPLSLNPRVLLQPEVFGNLLFLGLGASAICFVTWTFSLKRLGAAKASAYIYLVPVITILTAAIVISEPLTPLAIGGCFMALGGLILAESGRLTPKNPDVPSAKALEDH